MGIFGSKKERVVFHRHVAMDKDGRGASFSLLSDSHGNTKWTWRYDSGLADNLHTYMKTQEALTALEIELGMPLTFPFLHPDAKKESQEQLKQSEEAESRSRKLRDKEIANAPDLSKKAHRDALLRVWAEKGGDVSPDELVLGNFYYMGYDMGKYVRTFQGHQWDGFPEFADDPGEFDTWYVFENSDSAEVNDGSRWSATDWDIKKFDGDFATLEEIFKLNRSQHKPRKQNDRYF